MARLRSATVGSRPRTVPALDSAWGVQITQPTLSRITEQSTKLNAIIEQSTPDARNSPIHLESFLGRSSPKTPLSPSSSPSTERSFLSLEQVLNNGLLKTPTMSKSKIPNAAATTGRKVGTFSTKSKSDPMTPVKAGFQVPEGKGGFGFRSGLAMTGRKIMDGLTGKKSAPSPAPDTPAVAETPEKKEDAELDNQTPRGSQTEPRPKRKKRFSDIHRQQFAKMDSIANHYAVKRTTTPSTTPSAPKSLVPEITPKNALVQTPEMGLKNLKRAKSQAILGDREPPSSPSPQKRRPDTDIDSGREEDRSPVKVKRQRLDTNAVTLGRGATKAARFAGGVTSTPMKKPTFRNNAAPATVGGALSRNFALKPPAFNRAFPKPVSALNLTPSTTLSTPGSAAPSRIPSTPGRASSLRNARNPPATIGASKLNTMINFAEASTPAKPVAGRLAPTTVGGFTFRARRGPSGLGFNALSEIHDKKAAATATAGGVAAMMKFESRMGTPKVSENDPVGVEDPFAEGAKEMEWSAGTPVKAGKGRKRKCEEEHRMDDRDETEEKIVESEDEKMGGQTPQELSSSPAHEKAKSPPTRKKLRFDTSSGAEETPAKAPAKTGKFLAEAVEKANDRRKRLDYLATPKKKVAGEGDRLGRKGMWK